MPCWRRLIVILLLATFAPGSVLAAMPVVWCVGQDGHRAVEFKPSRSHKAHVVLGSKQDDVAKATEDKDDGCHDSQLIDKAKTAKAPAGGLLPFGLRSVIELRRSPVFAAASKLSPPACTGKRPVPDPERAARRSVILLI
jgi:hypothetical protein